VRRITLAFRSIINNLSNHSKDIKGMSMNDKREATTISMENFLFYVKKDIDCVGCSI
jgi:hypothetical protein